MTPLVKVFRTSKIVRVTGNRGNPDTFDQEHTKLYNVTLNLNISLTLCFSCSAHSKHGMYVLLPKWGQYPLQIWFLMLGQKSTTSFSSFRVQFHILPHHQAWSEPRFSWKLSLIGSHICMHIRKPHQNLSYRGIRILLFFILCIVHELNRIRDLCL